VPRRRPDHAVGDVDDVNLRGFETSMPTADVRPVLTDLELGCHELDRGDIAHAYATRDDQVARVVEVLNR
jgi:hypothetical protein